MLCGPRSWCATPVSILTGRMKTQFSHLHSLCCLDETRQFLLWTRLPTSVLHIPNLSEIALSVPKICDFKNWLSFLVFFLIFLFVHLQKLLYNANTISDCLEIWHTERGIKAHLGSNFGRNTINRQRVISDYSQKITPICCHAYRVNRLWEELKIGG